MNLPSMVAQAPLARPEPAPRGPKLWRPRRVLVTPAALEWEHGRDIVRRAEALGIETVRLKANRLSGLSGDDARKAYSDAKNTLAVVTASPAKHRLQPIPPSAGWRVDLAEGCPAHCQYCYLAGSLSGPPVTRVFANLPEILRALPDYAGRGRVSSAQAERAHEGTTFEASCYTDPLGIEQLTGSLSALIHRFGAWDAPVSLASPPSSTQSSPCSTFPTAAARVSGSRSMQSRPCVSRAARRRSPRASGRCTGWRLPAIASA